MEDAGNTFYVMVYLELELISPRGFHPRYQNILNIKMKIINKKLAGVFCCAKCCFRKWYYRRNFVTLCTLFYLGVTCLFPLFLYLCHSWESVTFFPTWESEHPELKPPFFIFTHIFIKPVKLWSCSTQ